jgi:transcription initiation factor TFIIH subunit 2
VLDALHYREVLTKFVVPLELGVGTRQKFIEMGFPIKSSGGLCNCHYKVMEKTFVCPRCKGVVCSLAKECECCLLLLVESTALARSFHHLFPCPEFVGVDGVGGKCFVCKDVVVYTCTSCNELFCLDCAKYVHQVLFNCPSCLSR